MLEYPGLWPRGELLFEIDYLQSFKGFEAEIAISAPDFVMRRPSKTTTTTSTALSPDKRATSSSKSTHNSMRMNNYGEDENNDDIDISNMQEYQNQNPARGLNTPQRLLEVKRTLETSMGGFKNSQIDTPTFQDLSKFYHKISIPTHIKTPSYLIYPTIALATIIKFTLFILQIYLIILRPSLTYLQNKHACWLASSYLSL